MSNQDTDIGSMPVPKITPPTSYLAPFSDMGLFPEGTLVPVFVEEDGGERPKPTSSQTPEALARLIARVAAKRHARSTQ